MPKAYNLGPKSAQGLRDLLREAAKYHPSDTSKRRTIPDVPVYAPTPTFWQVKYDATSGWIARVAANSLSVPGFVVQNVRIGATEWYAVQGAPAGTTEGLFSVYAHIKRRVKVANGTIKPCVFVSASAVGSSAPGAEAANHSAGDYLTIPIAVCGTEQHTGAETTTYSHSVTRTYRDRVTLPNEPDGLLQLYWACPAAPNSDWDTFTPHVAATSSAPICGGNLADTALPAASTAAVRYLIDCTGQSPSPSVVTTHDPADGKIYISVYSLADGCVADDTRANLANAVFYP